MSNLKEAQILELFPTPIYKNNLSDYPDRESLIKDTELYRDNMSSCWTSFNKNVILSYPNLENVILKEIKFYTEEVLLIDTTKIVFYISRSWIVKHDLKDFAQPHHHTNSLFSGILYINVDDESGNLGFPRSSSNSITPLNFQFDYKESNEFNTQIAYIKPENGDLLLFPSNVCHLVTENKSKNDRYVLIFDIFVRGTLGNGISKLII